MHHLSQSQARAFILAHNLLAPGPLPRGDLYRAIGWAPATGAKHVKFFLHVRALAVDPSLPHSPLVLGDRAETYLAKAQARVTVDEAVAAAGPVEGPGRSGHWGFTGR